ncbi:E3 ubiquitin ligase PQT3-like isoform X2 [Humulus lupulus]|uniref:E3 ubiquitin ligase PQT3-like isoform X2 n=1 Tax=Humulus lupulus TaxID=3486 RepID=UPI002B41231D|nr:E3 ubiquitin ligase PQT3-like isoform X2 [Humulus lupulus]
MAVRFKFRSSLTFDTVDIDGRPSISVRDLKSKIIRFKNLNLCQDFDLVLSDSLTGQEYIDENFQIPDGSSVIIKRVPAESVQANIAGPLSNPHENLRMKETLKLNPSNSQNVETLDFDDFGVDLYPVEATLSSSNLDVKRACINSDPPKFGTAAICSESPLRECQKLDASDLSDAVPGCPANDGNEGDSFQKKLEPKVHNEMKKVDSNKARALQDANLPSELKCSICNLFFKEAVMIPCCQHSFCQKCIYQVLLDKESCPKCFSTKYGVQNLLPNVSLRQAIEHFLESQILSTDSGNECQRYAPDGESGIQAKDVSCGVSVFQRALELPHSPSETGRGSNHIIVESPSKSKSPFKINVYNRYGSNDTLKSPPLLRKMKHIDKIGPGDVVDFDDFQGESQPVLEEVPAAKTMVKRKRESWIDNEGGHKSIVESAKHKKGARTCYFCGSPDHFIRDCPAAMISARPMLQTGNAMFPGAMPSSMPYWNGSSVPYVRPYGNLYGNGGMVPFNGRFFPSTPFAVPTYMSSMYHPMPAFGCMRMGGVAPSVGTIENHRASHPEFLGLQEHEKSRMLSNHNFRRELSPTGNQTGDFDELSRVGHKETPYDHKPREKILSYSADSSTKGCQRKHYRCNHMDDDLRSVGEYHQKNTHSLVRGRDQRQNHRSEKLSSEVDNLPCSSSWNGDEGEKHHYKSSKRHSGDREHSSTSRNDDEGKKHHHKSSKKHDVKKEHSSADFGRHHSHARNRSDLDKKSKEHDVKRHNHKHHYLESELEQSTSDDQVKQQKEAERSLKKSKYKSKCNNIEPSNERWKMISGSDEDGSEEYQYYRRKREH